MVPSSILQSLRPALRWPAAPKLGFLCGIVVGLTAIYASLAGIIPAWEDEYYYWCWAQSLQWSYYDHPLMSALFIRGSCELFGNSLVALRLPACLTTALVFAAILWLTRPRTVAWWLLTTPLFSLGACLMTPDTPLLLFWAGYVVWLVKVHERLSESEAAIPFRYWLIGGALLGCGVLGKYTMALAVPAGFLSFLVLRATGFTSVEVSAADSHGGKPRGSLRASRWLFGYALHGVIAFAVASPILIFNIQHDFEPLRYQWSHAMSSTGPSLKEFGDFVGMQLALFGTLPLTLFPWALWNARTFAANPRLRVALCLFGFPFAFFLYKAANGHLEGNWALASYIGFWPLAAEWYERNRGTRFGRWSLRSSFLAPILLLAIVVVHFAHPLPLFSPKSDRITRQVEKDKLFAEIAIYWQAQPLPLYTATYQNVAMLRFHGIDARQIDGMTRPSHFTQTPQHPSDVPESYILLDSPMNPHALTGLAEPVKVAEFPFLVRGEVLAVFYLWQVRRE